jgi:hypothetical protein
VVGCASAVGNVIPPMILFKGKRKPKPEWYDHMPPGTLTDVSPKGSMTALKFVKFLDHLGKHKPPGTYLLQSIFKASFLFILKL